MAFSYRVIAHDGGYAYAADDTVSETFTTHALALAAARRAVAEQRVSGETTTISYETTDGTWHREVAFGDDRPQTEVET